MLPATCSLPVRPRNPVRAFLGGFFHLWVGAILPLMRTVSTFVFSAGYVLGGGWEFARYAPRFGWLLVGVQ